MKTFLIIYGLFCYSVLVYFVGYSKAYQKWTDWLKNHKGDEVKTEVECD